MSRTYEPVLRVWFWSGIGPLNLTSRCRHTRARTMSSGQSSSCRGVMRTAALVAFTAGVICLLGALGVGLIFSVQTTLDWQAVQVWRIEWLLGATASFLAGLLLKKSAG